MDSKVGEGDKFIPPDEAVARPRRTARLGSLGKVCRLGLATRGNTALEPEAVEEAIERGVDYLNWPGRAYPDGLSAAVSRLGERRRGVFVAAQFMARTAAAARRELRDILGELGTTYVDVLTYYYVEHAEEWEEILARGGAAECLEEAKADGTVRAIGVTSHQRSLAADMARSGRLDLVMVRYNAAHTGAERDVFPVTRSLALPVVTYTGLRWGALLRSTPEDPPGYVVPAAPAWYRFVLCNPAVTVGIAAPNGSRELAEVLALLADWHGFSPAAYRELRVHGERVYRHAGGFP